MAPLVILPICMPSIRKRILTVTCLLVVGIAQGFFDLLDIGFLNGLDRPADLVLEYNSGRRIDLHLKPGEATIAGRLPGERLYRIEIAVRGRRKEALFASHVRSQAPQSRSPWVYTVGSKSRVISPQQRARLTLSISK